MAGKLLTPDFSLTTAQKLAREMLVSDATHCCLGGGSRSGKTALLIRMVIARALREPGSRHAVFRFRFNALKSSVLADTLPKIMQLCYPGLWERCELNRTDWFLSMPNGSEIWFGGLDDKDRVEKILGMEFATLYFNECSQIPWNSVVVARTRLAQKTKGLRLKAYYDMNPPSKVHWTYQVFVERRDPITRQPLKLQADYGFFLMNPLDNKENLDPKYLEELDALPEKARNRFLLGKFADVNEGALWTVELLAQQRILDTRAVPDLLRIVVAVDPSGCSGEEDYRSDEVGIVVCGLGIDGQGYLLEDLSGRYAPADWGRIATDAFKRHQADRVVGEGNYGGAMVEHVIRSADPDVTYASVTATRGKVVRAEPIAALYEQGRVWHVGQYEELEDQLCAMTVAGYAGLRSPDRADAAIWGFSELFPALTESKKKQDWTPPPVRTQQRKASRWDRKAI